MKTKMQHTLEPKRGSTSYFVMEARLAKAYEINAELLEACKAFAEGNMHDDKVLALVKSAIAKAEGK